MLGAETWGGDDDGGIETDTCRFSRIFKGTISWETISLLTSDGTPFPIEYAVPVKEMFKLHERHNLNIMTQFRAMLIK